MTANGLERAIRRVAWCCDRDTYLNYLKDLYDSVGDVCKRMLVAMYIAWEADDPRCKALVVDGLKDSETIRRCGSVIGEIVDECFEWLGAGELSGLLQVVKSVEDGADLEELSTLGVSSLDVAKCVVRKLVLEDVERVVEVLRGYASGDVDLEVDVLGDVIGGLVDAGRFDIVSELLARVDGDRLRDRLLELLARRLARVGRYGDAVELLRQVSVEELRDDTAWMLNHMFLREGVVEASLRLLDVVSEAARDLLAWDIVRALSLSGECEKARSLVDGMKDEWERGKGLALIAMCYAWKRMFDKALETVKTISNPAQAAYALLDVACEMRRHGVGGYEHLVEEAL